MGTKRHAARIEKVSHMLLDLIGGLQLQSEVEGTSLLREQSMHKSNSRSIGFGIQPGVEKRHFSKLH